MAFFCPNRSTKYGCCSCRYVRMENRTTWEQIDNWFKKTDLVYRQRARVVLLNLTNKQTIHPTGMNNVAKRTIDSRWRREPAAMDSWTLLHSFISFSSITLRDLFERVLDVIKKLIYPVSGQLAVAAAVSIQKLCIATHQQGRIL